MSQTSPEGVTLPDTSIQLIGAGLPRTGTLTQKMALEELGLGPCYHWVNVIADLDQVELWWSAMDGKPIWDDVFAGQLSTVDWPGGYFYRELLDAYPDAKVLLSVRDPEKWELSFRDTIWTMSHGETLMPLLARSRALIDPRWHRYLELVDRMFWGPDGTFKDGHNTPELMIAQMERHNDEVKRVVPSDRLLVWEVGEGWGPLCEFLELPVPDAPLPHANERDAFVERVVAGALDALGSWRQGALSV
jgi:Sulfotransferase domain